MQAWALPGHKEALNERDSILEEDLEIAKREGEYHDDPVSWDDLNDNVLLVVAYSDKPLPIDTTDFWWEEDAGKRMTLDIMEKTNRRVCSGKAKRCPQRLAMRKRKLHQLL